MKYNGTSYAWGQIFVKFQSMDEAFLGITNISVTEAQEKSNIYGQGYEPINRGYGNYTYEGSMTLKMEEVRKLIESSPNSRLLERGPEDLIITYQHPTSNKVVTDVIKNVEFTELGVDVSQNDMSIDIELPFIASGVQYGTR
jgi:hypothetical protein